MEINVNQTTFYLLHCIYTVCAYKDTIDTGTGIARVIDTSQDSDIYR